MRRRSFRPVFDSLALRVTPSDGMLNAAPPDTDSYFIGEVNPEVWDGQEDFPMWIMETPTPTDPGDLEAFCPTVTN